MHNRLKYSLPVWLLLFVMPFVSWANTQVEASLKKGNAEYAKSRYKEAAQSYQQVLDSGYESAAVYFNLGNANYKIGEMPAAILNYEKARKIAPGDEDIKLNLQLANLKITDKIEEVPEFFLTRWWRAFIFFFSTGVLSVFNVICLILGFILLIAYLFLIEVWPKKVAFYAGLLVLSVGLISFIMVGIQSGYLNGHQQGIVFAGAADVKGGPAGKEKTLFVIHAGTKVDILQNDSDWIKIILANGNGGWIKVSEIKEI